MLHRVEEVVLQRKHGPSINGRGDTESDLLFCSPPSEISKHYQTKLMIRVITLTYFSYRIVIRGSRNILKIQSIVK